tara:strand:+ start:172 stop:1581 length:1410 start_codon:yes stop_codon:yes gene_type:complete
MFGGPPVTLCESQARIRGADWGLDDQIIFGSQLGLYMVPGGGGEPTPLTELDTDKGESGHMWPSIIANHQSVVFTISKGTPLTTGELAVLDLETGNIIELGLAGVRPKYVSTGHIIYAAEDGSLRGVPFEEESFEVTGNPVPLLEDVVVKISGAADFSISDNGSLVYANGSFAGASDRSMVWVDREGNEQLAVPEARPFQEFNLSPDGTRVAARIGGSGNNVWVFDLVRNTNTRLTFDDDPSLLPTWTTDGGRVAFGAPLYWKAADGTGELEEITDTANIFPQAFSPNDELLVVQRGVGDSTDLGMISMDEDGPITFLLEEGFGERNGSLSPDGNWLAYESNETGAYEIYVRPFPNVDSGRWEVSSNGGIMPQWNPTGDELFFRSAEGMMALAFELEPTFRPGIATKLFDMQPYFTALANRRIAVAPDGQRFLLLKDSSSGPNADITRAPQVNVVLNWFEELKDRIPVP